MSGEALREPIDRLFINRNRPVQKFKPDRSHAHGRSGTTCKCLDVDAPQDRVDAHTWLPLPSGATLKGECD